MFPQAKKAKKAINYTLHMWHICSMLWRAKLWLSKFSQRAYNLVEERDKYFKHTYFLLKELHEINLWFLSINALTAQFVSFLLKIHAQWRQQRGFPLFQRSFCNNAGKSMLNWIDVQVSFQGKIKAKPSFIFNTMDLMKFFCLIWRNENL